MTRVADLADLAVFLDFDGTMTAKDTAVHVLERFGGDHWLEPEEDYRAGRIGSRECLQRQWDCVTASEEECRAAAREVPVDPGLASLAAYLRTNGATVMVVSDGYGFRAREVAAEHGLDVLSNDVDFATNRVIHPPRGPCPTCDECGTCKAEPIRTAQAAGRTTMLVGDGASDRRAAVVADIVFAKDGLAEWCRDNEVRHAPFTTLADVEDALRGGVAALPFTG